MTATPKPPEEAKPNTSAEVTLHFGGQERKFALKIKQIDELQRLCGAGIGEIVQRLHVGNFHVRDVYDTIRLGLIGGGTLNDYEATLLVDTYIEGQPLARKNDPNSNWKTAKAIAGAVFVGLDELKETEGEPDPNKKKDESPVVPAG